MKNIIATITTSYEIKHPDQDPQIKELGYNPEYAKTYALKELKYECFSDFTNPWSCKPGHAAECFKAEGVEMNKEEDEDDIAEALGWEYAVILKYKGKKYAFPPDYNEWLEGEKITSDEILKELKNSGEFPD